MLEMLFMGPILADLLSTDTQLNIQSLTTPVTNESQLKRMRTARLVTGQEQLSVNIMFGH